MSEKHVPFGPYERWLKRPMDVCCVLVGLALFWWVAVIVALLVRLKLGSPVIFHQDRPGRDGKVFRLYKFRTMTDQRDEKGELLPDQQRLTKFGKLLRSTSLDELPELWNILKGDMSLVGPRPLLVKYLPLYSAEQSRRHEVTPGLTGWAQVHGRNAITWEERFALDVWYVDHVSLKTDLAVLFLTVKKVLCREGISAAGEATMGEFRGSEVQVSR